jgi:hypothetical protein
MVALPSERDLPVSRQFLPRRRVPAWRLISNAAVAHIHAIDEGIVKRPAALDDPRAHTADIGICDRLATCLLFTIQMAHCWPSLRVTQKKPIVPEAVAPGAAIAELTQRGCDPSVCLLTKLAISFFAALGVLPQTTSIDRLGIPAAMPTTSTARFLWRRLAQKLNLPVWRSLVGRKQSRIRNTRLPRPVLLLI